MSAAVRPDRLLAHLRALEGERHPLTSPARLAEAERHVTGHWHACGLRVSSDELSYNGAPVVNRIALPPQAGPGPRLLGMLSLEMVGFTETRGLQQYPTRWLARQFPAQGTYIGLAAAIDALAA